MSSFCENSNELTKYLLHSGKTQLYLKMARLNVTWEPRDVNSAARLQDNRSEPPHRAVPHCGARLVQTSVRIAPEIFHEKILFLPTAYVVWGKVMFLRATVYPLGRGWRCVQEGFPFFRREVSHFSVGSIPPTNTGIWSMRGKYASYWNAFLLLTKSISSLLEIIVKYGDLCRE